MCWDVPDRRSFHLLCVPFEERSFEGEVELIRNVGLRQVVVLYRTHLTEVIDIADLKEVKKNLNVCDIETDVTDGMVRMN